MKTTMPLTRYFFAALALCSAGGAFSAVTDISTVPLNTYSATASTDVKPNVLFILDDSGSMDWAYLPDWANDNSPPEYRAKNPGFNGLAYNPATRYAPPLVAASSGALDATLYKSQTGNSTATGGDSAATVLSRNWNSVKTDAYGIQSSSVANLTPNTSSAPFFFTTLPGEYCTTGTLKTCITANGPTEVAGVQYTFPAYLRWCNSSALSTCKSGYDKDTAYTNPRMPSPSTSTLTVAGTSAATAIQITVDNQRILSLAAGGSSTTSSAATAIVNAINDCTYALQGACQVMGFKASRSNATITITSPTGTTSTPLITVSAGTSSSTVTPFTPGAVPGKILRTTLYPGNDTYGYPGTVPVAKHSNRTDCAGSTCTYLEEMTNYANWYTYYQTRMQMMKTSAANAFADLDTAADLANGKSRFRIGFMTINNNTSADFVNLAEFTGTQKFNWYTKLLRASPNNSTPLRAALSMAGRLYAGRLSTLNSVAVADPLQYSCQQNYALLSTDGYWNSGAGYKLDGSTAVGNQDPGANNTPFGDGASVQWQERTYTLQYATVALQAQSITNPLQSSTLSQQAVPLDQTRSRQNANASWSSWTDTASLCTKSTTVDCQYSRASSFNLGVTWTFSFGSTPCVANSTPDSNGRIRQCAGSTVSTWSSWANVSSCTTSPTVQCQYQGWTSTYTNVASCTPVEPSASSPFTVGIASRCKTVAGTATAWTNATSACVAASTMNCRYVLDSSTWQNVNSCTVAAQNNSNLKARECQFTSTGGTSDTLADVAAYYYNTDLRSPVAADGTGTCTGPVISPATTANDLCANNVPTSTNDVVSTQHMTTFTLGLGAPGKMVPPVLGQNTSSEDFVSILNKATASTSTGVCSWQITGQCFWPIPASDSSANIDDLWHAAINGHGGYFSATDPATLAGSLGAVLKTISNVPRPGAAAAAASSNPNVSTSDNFVFSSSYESVSWYGELIRQQITSTGALTAQNWTATRLLDCLTTPWTANTTYNAGQTFRNGTACYAATATYRSGNTFDNSATGIDRTTQIVNQDEAAATLTPVNMGSAPARTIYTNGGSSLVPFTWGTLGSNLKGTFTQAFLEGGTTVNGVTSSNLSQFCTAGTGCLDSASRAAAAGENLVKYLAGDRSYEGVYYRARKRILGDIVSSEARYVKAPLFNYTDPGYAGFKAAKAGRNGSVYAGSNDGMLHAFDAVSGKENWAFIPAAVLPNLYKLADNAYADKHQYFVDATPEVGEICVPASAGTACAAADWKTILVGGLNRGGKGYYALDITNPSSPVLLWELGENVLDANGASVGTLGYTYGNPVVTKLKDGTWVVMVTSGYNNADGIGKLYVLNAVTGKALRAISTGVGSANNPSGLSRIVGHSPTSDTNNTSIAAYGGDLLGNLWRFDINNDMGAAGYDAQKLVSFTNAAGVAQPVTAQPTVTTLNDRPVIFVGTGRYLGVDDISDNSFQSFYAVVDKGDNSTYANPRASGSGFIAQTLTDGTCPGTAPVTVCTTGQTVRTSSANNVSLGTDNGWFIDFVNGGERASTDPTLGLGTLLFTTNLPAINSANACGDPALSSARAFIYALDYKTGGAISNSGSVSGVSLGSGAVTRPVLIRLADGSVRSLTRVSGGSTGQGTDMGTTVVRDVPVSSSSTPRRVSWRELTTQ